ncbi:MAG: SH3 domain-containing protein [Candidatus Woesebacteria bacterium]
MKFLNALSIVGLTLFLFVTAVVPAFAQGNLEVTGSWMSIDTTEVSMKANGLSGPLKWHVHYLDASSCATGRAVKDDVDLFHRSTLPDEQNKFNEMNCGNIEYSAKDIQGNRVSQVVHIASHRTSTSLTLGSSSSSGATGSATASNLNCQFRGGEASNTPFVQVLVHCLNIRQAPDTSKNNILARATFASRLTWISTFLTSGNFPWYQIKLPDGTTGWMAGGGYSKVTL